MKRINDKDLKKIIGGVSIWAILGSIAGLVFGIGVVDGYTRPFKCRK